MTAELQAIYQQRLTNANDAILKTVQDGCYIVMGHAAAAPQSLSKALFECRLTYRDVTLFHMLYFGEAWHMRPEMQGHLRVISNFLEKNSRQAYAERRIDYLPCHFHEVPELFTSGIYPVDIALIQVSRPDEEGYCSLGISCDYTHTAAKCARIVIAEVNAQMPFIKGENTLHISEIDYIIEIDRPLVAIPPSPIGEVEREIGRLCSELIQDGATLQLGIGAIPEAVLQFVHDRKDLGIHTEMFSDGVMQLMRSGHITGLSKTLHPARVISTLIMGTEELYRFLDGRDDVLMYPVSYTNDPYIIGLNDKLISINSCLQIDLTGQVASEAIGTEQFSGTGGQVDFVRGARRSRGGCSILAFASTAQGGCVSRIVPLLPEGSQVTTGRNDVDYVVTEYGRVRLRGLSLRERAEALVSIAHPKFRAELEEAVRKRFYTPLH